MQRRHPLRGDVGRAQAVQYDTLTYRPQGQAPELKYFLAQFVAMHFARMRATVQERYAQSLYFLDSALADATIAQNQRSQPIEAFLAAGKPVFLVEYLTAPDQIQLVKRNAAQVGMPVFIADRELDHAQSR